MRFGGQYVLGIDALPCGNYAAVAVGRTITETFLISRSGADALPLEERVRRAIVEAGIRRGAPPAAVRLVCVDDGADGSELGSIHQWLEDEIKAQVQILDLVGKIKTPDIDESGQPVDPTAALSVARACEAALW
ncbi:MAG: hypothetical protein GY724_08985 [Actinomycetia bacterium]|nr:hypothetical protein [Actinomycetes bacterium]